MKESLHSSNVLLFLVFKAFSGYEDGYLHRQVKGKKKED